MLSGKGGIHNHLPELVCCSEAVVPLDADKEPEPIMVTGEGTSASPEVSIAKGWRQV